jgi:hypothetical protein
VDHGSTSVFLYYSVRPSFSRDRRQIEGEPFGFLFYYPFRLPALVKHVCSSA